MVTLASLQSLLTALLVLLPFLSVFGMSLASFLQALTAVAASCRSVLVQVEEASCWELTQVRQMLVLHVEEVTLIFFLGLLSRLLLQGPKLVVVAALLQVALGCDRSLVF